MPTPVDVERKLTLPHENATRRDAATTNLDKLLRPHKKLSNRYAFINLILETYGINGISDIGPHIKHDLAMECLTLDYLWSNFYGPDGVPTKYGKAYLDLYKNRIDLSVYRYAGVDAEDFFGLLVRNVKADFRGTIGLIEEFIERYKDRREDPPLIIMPGYLEIGEDCVNFNEATGFIPPFGGGETDVTIYLNPYVLNNWMF